MRSASPLPDPLAISANPVRPIRFARGLYITEPRFLFMTLREWLATFIFSAAVMLLLYPLYMDVSLWFGLGVGLMTMLLINTAFASSFVFSFPQLAALVALVQHLMASWGAYYYPSQNDEYNIGGHLTVYLSYAGPLCLAFLAGLFLPLVHTARLDAPRIRRDPRGEIEIVVAMRWLLSVGIFVTLVSSVLRLPAALQFLVHLVGYLRYVGLFGLMLLNSRRWKVSAAAVTVMELQMALSGGMFHQLVLFGTFLAVFLGYRLKWRFALVPVFVLGLIFIMMLQNMKIQFRDVFWHQKIEANAGPVETFFNISIRAIASPAKSFSRENLSETMMRLNQGWIVDRVMLWTPMQEPFAHGSVLWRSVVGSLVPRLLWSGKELAVNADQFERFTGRRLRDTAMTLGYAGEMYANFGRWGGVLAVGLHGLFLGLVYRWFYNRAVREPLWWAWAAYVMFVAVKAESSLSLVTNWIVKAAVVMAAVLWLSPSMRRALFPPAPVDVRRRSALREGSFAAKGERKRHDPFSMTRRHQRSAW